jgi:acetoacetyl-CoA synthetase
MGTSEIYRAVLRVRGVVDALVVDVPSRAGFPDGWMPLFVVLADGANVDDELVAAIRAQVRRDCSPRHAPDEVHRVDAVPRTLSGKLLEVPIRRILMGADPDVVASRQTLANPESLDWFLAFRARL